MAKAGCYCFGGNRIPELALHFEHKPIWFHRIMMKLCFGVYWLDEAEFNNRCKE